MGLAERHLNRSTNLPRECRSSSENRLNSFFTLQILNSRQDCFETICTVFPEPPWFSRLYQFIQGGSWFNQPVFLFFYIGLIRLFVECKFFNQNGHIFPLILKMTRHRRQLFRKLWKAYPTEFDSAARLQNVLRITVLTMHMKMTIYWKPTSNLNRSENQQKLLCFSRNWRQWGGWDVYF